MGTRLPLVLALVCGCGRVGFDAIAPGDGSAPATDGQRDGAAGSDGLVTTPITLAQQGAVAAGTTNLMPGLPQPSTAGTLLVAAIATNGTSGVGLPPGWSLANQVSLNGSCSAIVAYYAANPGGITTATFTQIAGTPGVGELTEWTAAVQLDVTGVATSSSPTAMQSVQTASATTVLGDLAISAYCEDVNNPTYMPQSGWTALGTYSNVSSSPSFESDYQLGEPTAVVVDTATSSVAGKYAAVLATFHP